MAEKSRGEQVVEQVRAGMWATKDTNVDSWFGSNELFQMMDDVQNGYIYVDKKTGIPVSKFSIDANVGTMGEHSNAVAAIQILDSYKKVAISSIDQTLANKWVDNTSRFVPLKDYWQEFGKEGLQNL